jgi:hypothetical protein
VTSVISSSLSSPRLQSSVNHSYFILHVTYLPGVEPASFVPSVPRSIRYTTGDVEEESPAWRHAATAPVHSFSSGTPPPLPPLPAPACASVLAPLFTFRRVRIERWLLGGPAYCTLYSLSQQSLGVIENPQFCYEVTEIHLTLISRWCKFPETHVALTLVLNVC